MGFLSKLVGLGVGDLADGIGKAIDRFVETPEEKKAAELLLLKAKQDPAKWQAEISKVSASHRSLFVAGARPAILWVCSIGFCFTFLINPILQWATGNPGPELQTDVMMELTLGMLGLAGLRTFEKIKGVSK